MLAKLRRIFVKEQSSQYEELLRDVGHWFDKYIVDTPESREYPGAQEMSKRIRSALPTRTFSPKIIPGERNDSAGG